MRVRAEQPQGQALGVQLHLGLGKVEVQGPAGLPAQLPAQAGHVLHVLQHRAQGLVFAGPQVALAIEPGLDLLVGEAPGRMDDAGGEFAVQHLALLVQGHQRAHGQAVHVRLQRAEAVAQGLGQHGQDAVRQVDAGGALVGFLVQGRTGLHVVGHVGDVHAQLPVAVVQADQRHGVVKVLGVGPVDGEEDQCPQVHAPGLGLFRRLRGEGPRPRAGWPG